MRLQKSEALARYKLNRTLKTIENCYYAMSNQYLMPLDITLSQCEILSYLYQSPSEKVETAKLLDFLQVARSSMSSTLNKLERKGYIRYFNDGGDMRKSRFL